MPGGDRTGPMGIGPMTGRGMGYCAGYNRGPARGLGRGLGRGAGRGYARGAGRFMYGGYPVGSPYPLASEDKALMEDQVKFLEEELEIARKQLARISEPEGK
mgnify:CR=1 FL=1